MMALTLDQVDETSDELFSDESDIIVISSDEDEVLLDNQDPPARPKVFTPTKRARAISPE